MSIMSMIKSVFRKIEKKPKVQKYVIYAVMLYVVYKIINEIRFGFFNQSGIIEGMETGSKLTLFHMTGCGHCEKMMPEWDKFSKLNPNSSAKYEASSPKGKELGKEHGVQGYPTILLLDANNKKLKDYDKGRTAAEFKAFITEN